MADKLEPCARCGKYPHLWVNDTDNLGFASVICQNCDIHHVQRDLDMLTHSWNRRQQEIRDEHIQKCRKRA